MGLDRASLADKTETKIETKGKNQNNYVVSHSSEVHFLVVCRTPRGTQPKNVLHLLGNCYIRV
jgi:hypothetical protein